MRNVTNRLAVAVLALVFGASAAQAQGSSAMGSMSKEKVLLNVDRQGMALEGYDPVSFFGSTPPVKGMDGLTSQWQGATYRFASAEHKAAFDKDPARFAPQFGGYCAYAASKGHTASVEIDAYQVVDGRLLMQNSKSVRQLFNKDTAGNLKLADQNWPAIVAREGKPAAQ